MAKISFDRIAKYQMIGFAVAAVSIGFIITIISTLILTVVGVVSAIYVLRFALQNSSSAPYASLIASILNTVQIQIFNYIYAELSIKLTNYENHRTDTEYEDAMIVKSFAFQFINSYASFFFLAFIASYLSKSNNQVGTNFRGQCGAPTCMTPLHEHLLIPLNLLASLEYQLIINSLISW